MHDLFHQPTGDNLAQQGMNTALIHAEEMHEKWGDKAFEVLKEYVKDKSGWQFLGEQVRFYAEAHKLPEPPSKRAWGSIMIKAAKLKLIKKVGYGQVSNPTAHSATSAKWQVI